MSERTVLWTADDAAAATGGRNSKDWAAGGVTIDSRQIAEGDLFVALAGPNFDGHDFVAEALAQGAAAAMVRKAPRKVAKDAPLLKVKDSFAALGALARAARARARARVIAVTGSVGKTGVKEALRLVLAAQGSTEASAGNLNNEFGVPLSLARLHPDSDIAIFELGMNHAGELTPLSELVRPDVAIITTIAPAHAEFFKTVADIADAKAEIFNGMRGGTAILNRDNAYFATLAVAAYASRVDRIVGFGAHPEATARVLGCSPEATGSQVSAEIGGKRLDFRIGAPGRHWVINSLAVLAAVEAVGADVARAAAALADVEAPEGRGRSHRVALAGGDFELIDDSYNASPASMRAAFDTLSVARPGAGGRRLAVLGDMLELGQNSAQLHAGLAPPLIAAEVDMVFTSGPQMAHLRDALPKKMRAGHADSAHEIVAQIVAAVQPGDVVCVKGSLGSRMGLVVEALHDIERENGPPRAVNG